MKTSRRRRVAGLAATAAAALGGLLVAPTPAHTTVSKRWVGTNPY